MKTNSTILKMFTKKLALVLLLAVIAVGAFATLGDGKERNVNPEKKSLLSIKNLHSSRFIFFKVLVIHFAAAR